MGTLYMETTRIEPEKTVAEIISLLKGLGLRQIMQDYDDDGLAGLAFRIECSGNLIPFILPIHIEPVFKLLNHRRQPGRRNEKAPDDLEQARRVAWRILYKWIQSQVAFIETGMVKTEEVFFSYMATPDGSTLFKMMEAKGLHKALPAPQDRA